MRRIAGTPNRISPKANANAGTNPYINTALFSEETLGRLGHANHRFFHGPGLNDWDLALIKDLRLTESKWRSSGESFLTSSTTPHSGCPRTVD